jgi:tetratricopeptide (TPR) repeat protein
VVDETPDELDSAVVADDGWTAPEVAAVGEEAAMEAKMAAVEAAGNGDWEAAVAQYAVALTAMPSAMVYAKRAEALLRLGRPAAAAADCEKALEVNPDSAKAFKVLGRALAKRGEWAAAYSKVTTGQKIDYDEDTADFEKVLKAKVEKAKKIGEQRGRRAGKKCDELGLADVWASLELDVAEKYGEPSLEALAKWAAKDVVSLKARLGALGATEAQTESLLGALPA